MAPSDTAEKNSYIGAQPQFIECIKAPMTFWKIYYLYDFGAHKLVHSEPFKDYLYEL